MTRTSVLATPALLFSLICIAAPADAASPGGQRRGGTGVGRAAPRAGAPRGPVGHVAPRIVGRVGVAPYGFARPYYTFRPRVSLGFGLWVGFPVSYPYYYPGYGYRYPYIPYAYGPYAYGPYSYASPYPYASPYRYASPYGGPAYGYPPSGYPPANYPPPAPGSVAVQPGQAESESGGVSFEITPDTAAVYVDGQYVGTVANFTPTAEPLALTPGRHRLEVRSPGYQTMTFDADVTPGQVTPFQGTMQPVRPF
jgi:hypothetical protein